MKILENVNLISGVFRDFNCDFSQTQRGLCNNKYAFDLCAFYMAQVGEKVKLLTDGTYNELNKVASLRNFQYFRNIIDHDYDNVNKLVLQAYIQSVLSPQFINALKARITYCMQNKKK